MRTIKNPKRQVIKVGKEEWDQLFPFAPSDHVCALGEHCSRVVPSLNFPLKDDKELVFVKDIPRILLNHEAKKALGEVGEMNRLFDLQRTRVREATKEWQKETGNHHIWPDLGDLVCWLMRKAGFDVQAACGTTEGQSGPLGDT